MTETHVLADAAAERRQRTLRKRAELLGEPPTPQASEAKLEVLVCRVQDERYAVDLRELRSVQRATGLTRVPSAPPQVAGVLNVRGDLVAVLDLAATLGLASTALTPATLTLLVEVKQGVVGLLVDDVLEIRLLLPERLDRSITAGASIRGIADGSLVLLDLERLLSELALGEPEETNDGR